MTIYPSSKDTTSTFYVIDGVTPIDAALFRKFSSAILAIENELGINPSGVFSDVRQRLDAIDGYASAGGFLPIGTIYQHVQNDGSSWVAVDNLTLPATTIAADTREITAARGSIKLSAGQPADPLKSVDSTASLNLYGGGGGRDKHGVEILGGEGIDGASDNTSDGGDIYIVAGDGGLGSPTNGYGGNIGLYAGTSNANNVGYGDGSYIDIYGGGVDGENSVGGYVELIPGAGRSASSFGGNLYLNPGKAVTEDKIGRIFINPGRYEPYISTNKYSIYANTQNVDAYYPGLRYNGNLNRWEIKNDGYSEDQWFAIGTGTGSSTFPSATQYQHLEYDGYNWLSVSNITLPSELDDGLYRTIQPDFGNFQIKAGKTFVTAALPETNDYTEAQINLYSSNNSWSGTYGGYVEILASYGTTNQPNGGEVSLYGGDGDTGGDAGWVTIYGGNGEKENATESDSGCILLQAGTQYADNSVSGKIELRAGHNYGTNGIGGNIYLEPGGSNSSDYSDVGKILINSGVYLGTGLHSNKYPIYINTENIDGYYPGIRYNGDLNRWELKNDGYTEEQWFAIGTGTGSGSGPSSSTIINIEWNAGVSDGYIVYEGNYSSSPVLKIAKLALANSYSTSKVIGSAYSTTNYIVNQGVYSVYCESSASPGDDLYLSATNSGMVTNVYPSTSSNCIVRIGKCFTEKSSGIGRCDVLLDIQSPVLLEDNL